MEALALLQALSQPSWSCTGASPEMAFVPNWASKQSHREHSREESPPLREAPHSPASCLFFQALPPRAGV